MEATDLAKFQSTLEELRGDLRKQLEDLGANPDEDSLDRVDFDFGFADSAQSTAERGKVLALVERLRGQLRDVDHALVKVHAGTYGACDSCGQQISVERLEAIPYSTLCLSCKQKAS